MAANPFDGMTIVTMSYVGPITPGGEDMALNGTAQVSSCCARLHSKPLIVLVRNIG